MLRKPDYSGEQMKKTEMVGHVACMGRGKVQTDIWWENLKEGNHLKDHGVDGRIILKWILEKWDGSIDWIDLAQHKRHVAGCCECGNEP